MSKDVRYARNTEKGCNLSLHLHFVSSHQNPADLPSRRLSLADSKLSSQLWAVIQTKFCGSRGHSFDLLASNSNAQRDLSSASLPFFSPTPSPYAAGVNVFAQHISSAEDSRFENCYAFPPFALIGPLINFLRQERAHCTLVVPDIFPRKYWWPIVSFLFGRTLKGKHKFTTLTAQMSVSEDTRHASAPSA